MYSSVDTDYEPCACSATGKMNGTSQPYAPGGSPNWTNYTYVNCCWYCLSGVSNTSSPTSKPMINFNTFANGSPTSQRLDIIHELAHYLLAIPSEGLSRTSADNNKMIEQHCSKTLNAN